MSKSLKFLVFMALLVASLLVSIAFKVFVKSDLVRITLFFPVAGNHQIHSEFHAISSGQPLTDLVKEIAESSLRGPVSRKFMRIAPADSSVLSVSSNKGVVDINLSATFLAPDAMVPLAPADRVNALLLSIAQNIGHEHTVNVYIEGRKVN